MVTANVEYIVVTFVAVGFGVVVRYLRKTYGYILRKVKLYDDSRVATRINRERG